MPRSANAKTAVRQYEAMRRQHEWTPATAWHGIALLLLTCNIWRRRRWNHFHDVVVYRERNDFRIGTTSPNAVLRRAESLTVLLANELGIGPDSICEQIGAYWRLPGIADRQPNNLVGHAFRSPTVHILQKFGNPEITYAEEVNPHTEFPGPEFSTRSQDPKVDIVARRDKVTVAIISSRWRFRHDRVDVVEEAMAYVPAARRYNSDCRFYACVGQFAPNRLDKILAHCPPQNRHGPVDATVHFAPHLITQGLDQNGRMEHVKSLEWLIGETHNW